jgi:hypothetical protein
MVALAGPWAANDLVINVPRRSTTVSPAPFTMVHAKPMLPVAIHFQLASVAEGQQEPAGVECRNARLLDDHLAVLCYAPNQSFGIAADALMSM